MESFVDIAELWMFDPTEAGVSSDMQHMRVSIPLC